MKECHVDEQLQPLKGLMPLAVDEAFKDYAVSEELKETVIQKSMII